MFFVSKIWNFIGSEYVPEPKRVLKKLHKILGVSREIWIFWKNPFENFFQKTIFFPGRYLKIYNKKTQNSFCLFFLKKWIYLENYGFERGTWRHTM